MQKEFVCLKPLTEKKKSAGCVVNAATIPIGVAVRQLILIRYETTLRGHSPARKVLVQTGRIDDVDDIFAINIHHADVIALIGERPTPE